MASRRLAIPTLLVFSMGYSIGHARAGQTSSVALSPDERTAGAVSQDAHTIVLWDWAGDGRVRVVPVGREPRTLVFSPDGRMAYVASQSSQTLDLVDVLAGATVGAVEVGGQPYGVLVSPDGRFAFVSQYAGGYVDGAYHAGLVAVVDLASREPVARIPVKARPWAMAIRPEDRADALYVTHYLCIAGEGWVTEIDPWRHRVLREIPLREDDGVRDGRGGVFNALASIALHPGGKRAIVAGMHANVRRGSALTGQSLSHKTTVQAAIRVIDLPSSGEMHEARLTSSFDGQAVAVPSAVAFIGAGRYYIDVYFASNDFKIIEYNERGLVAERALRPLPAGPTGVAITRDGGSAFVSSRWDRSVSRISLADVRDPQPVRTVRASPEPWEDRLLLGANLFHDTRDCRMTANRWMSCAVCHLDGGLVSDGLNWDLSVSGNRPKIGNTMDLLNTRGTSPPFFHRGEASVVEDLERFVRTFQKGSGFLDAPRGAPGTLAGVPAGASGGATRIEGRDRPDGDGVEASSPEWDAILAYVSALRPRPNPHAQDGRPRPEIRDAAARGRELFTDPRRRCAHCHDGPSLTVSGRGGARSIFDVGTGGAVDTPSLLNLWDTAPYLHDGRAATLLDVLTVHNREDRHGRTSDLGATELEDLVSFLLAPYDEERP